MNCKLFKQLYSRFSALPLSREVWDSDEYTTFGEHLHICSECSNWYMQEEVKRRGFDPGSFTCVHVAYYSTHQCETHNDPFECPDTILIYDERMDSYGIPIHDGGSSVIQIAYCPWCGMKLLTNDDK